MLSVAIFSSFPVAESDKRSRETFSSDEIESHWVRRISASNSGVSLLPVTCASDIFCRPTNALAAQAWRDHYPKLATKDFSMTVLRAWLSGWWLPNQIIRRSLIFARLQDTVHDTFETDLICWRPESKSQFLILLPASEFFIPIKFMTTQSKFNQITLPRMSITLPQGSPILARFSISTVMLKSA